ncbi:H+/gluconate symporter [Rhodococcoides kyotonense]|uniref:H+/gluconate symporter n=2 Tax=Rhodococcoides kyotonense TaxID=398843 RepID=A0A239MGF7_9NOCA|nr:H+/gluconate symporter [Rhodococcus kyotonensis]
MESMSLIHIAISVVGVVAIIVAFKIEPVIALVLGGGYLGIATGQGFAGTTTEMVEGFGSVMTEIGLFIAFGVLLGALVEALGVPQRVAEGMLRIFGRRGLPYAHGLSLGVVLASVFADVLIVLSGPLTRHASSKLGKNGHGLLSGVAITGITAGLVFVVPGTALMAVVGILGIPIGTALLYALPLGIMAIVLTVAVYSTLIRLGLWDEERDESEVVGGAVGSEGASEGSSDGSSDGSSAGGGVATATRPTTSAPPLLLLSSPLIVAVGLMLTGAFLAVFEVEGPVTEALGNVSFALFVGVCLAYILARRYLGVDAVSTAVGNGMRTSGSILILTGVGGGFAALVNGSGVGDQLTEMFGSSGGAPILVAWVIAAILHAAVGSITLGAMTAVGILGPVVAAASPSGAMLLALAALAGALFGGLPNANGFWLFKSVYGLSVRGTLKTYTLGPSICSVVSLALILVVSAVV